MKRVLAILSTCLLAIGIGASSAMAEPPLRVVITALDGTPLSAAPTFPATVDGAFQAAAARGAEPSPERTTPEFQQAIEQIRNRVGTADLNAAQIPPYLLELCKRDPRAAAEEGHVFHRSFWCQRAGLRAKAYRGTRLSGEVSLKWIAAMVGSYKTRTSSFYLQPTMAGEGWGDFGNEITTMLKAGPKCSPVAGDPGCSTNTIPITMSVADWKREVGLGTWFGWRFTSDETQTTKEDLVSNHKWHITTGVTTPEAGVEWGDNTPDIGLRCDSATYFLNDPKACMNIDVIPWVFMLRPLYPEIADHVRQAQDAPDTTFPREPHIKQIPGKYFYGDPNKPGLHRIAASEEGPNRAVVQAACKLLPPHDPDEECDEYPFASTVEGAAHEYWDYSVKYADGQQNGKAGTDLQTFYAVDRMLYRFRDQFWVNVVG